MISSIRGSTNYGTQTEMYIKSDLILGIRLCANNIEFLFVIYGNNI